MRLADLEPRWVAYADDPHAAMFFRCPHCVINGAESRVWLTVTFRPIPLRDQFVLAQRTFGRGYDVAPARGDFAWWRSGAGFDDLSVAPSVDYSNGGHWHGFIVAGQIRTV
jgi:hypothetical protein